MATQNLAARQFFARSWRLLTREKGWYKPILVLACCQFVPIAGQIVLLGYALEWARLSAWGIESVPKQRDVNITECFKAGFRGFVISLVWSIIWTLILWIICSVLTFGVASSINFKNLVLGPIGLIATFGGFGFIAAIMSVFMHVVTVIAMVRATIYTNISAGLNPIRVFELFHADVKGACKIALIGIASMVITGLMFLIGYMIVIFMGLSRLGSLLSGSSSLSKSLLLSSQSYSSASSSALDLVFSFLYSALPILVIAGFVAMLISVATCLLETNAVGLWVSQFDVASWGGHTEPHNVQAPVTDNTPQLPQDNQTPSEPTAPSQPQ